MRLTLADQQQPSVPLILRGKKRAKEKRKLSQMPSSDPKAIRLTLDNNLQEIFRQIKSRRSFSTAKPRQQISYHPIPKLNQKLVRQYINFVYKQYKIRDPLGDITVNSLPRQNIATQKKQYLKPFYPNSTNRKAIQLKESFLIEMFSPTSQKHQISHQPSYQYSSIKQARSTTLTNSPPKHYSKLQHQVSQSYRYCFICEQPILEANIEIHETTKCPQFATLYSMSINELREVLLKKIDKIKQNIMNNMRAESNKSNNRIVNSLQNLQNETNQYIQTINHTIFNCRQIQRNLITERNQVKRNFDCVMKEFETNYFVLYAQLKKLQWFVSMYYNLQNKYGNVSLQTMKIPKKGDIKPDRRFSLAH